jgi:NTP pyrophosphatase (non-canonical NTP hydrolase)
MSIEGFQKRIEDLYFDRDRARGVDRTFVWFVEEVGELARALKGNDREHLRSEFADVFAWLATLASLEGIRLEEAASKYGDGCPKCGSTPCACPWR